MDVKSRLYELVVVAYLDQRVTTGPLQLSCCNNTAYTVGSFGCNRRALSNSNNTMAVLCRLQTRSTRCPRAVCILCNSRLLFSSLVAWSTIIFPRTPISVNSYQWRSYISWDLCSRISGPVIKRRGHIKSKIVRGTVSRFTAPVPTWEAKVVRE